MIGYKKLEEMILTSDIESLQYLIKGEDFDINRRYEGDTTILHCAIKNNRLEMTKFLIEHGADVNLMWKESSCLYLAIRFGKINLIKLVLAHVSDINQKCMCDLYNDKNFTPLYHSIRLQRFNAAELLMECKADVNIDGPLHLVIDGANHRFVDLLINHGADPNCKDEDGMIAFHRQFVLKNPERRNLFLKHGADVFAKNQHGRNVLYYALLYAEYEYVQHLLQTGLSAKHRDAYRVEPLNYLLFAGSSLGSSQAFTVPRIQLLIDYGADVNAIHRGETPLCWSAKNGQMEIVKCLLNAGATIDVKDIPSLICQAIEGGHIEVVEYLIKRGARLDVRSRGRTLFGLAVKVNWQIVQLLMESGSTVSEDDYKDLSQQDGEKLEAYQREFDTIKVTKVCDNYNVTYLDLLVKRGNDLVQNLRSAEILKEVQLDEHKKWFPLFYDRMEANLSRGYKTIRMLDDVSEILFSIFPVQLPYDVITLIGQYLDNEDCSTILTLRM